LAAGTFMISISLALCKAQNKTKTSPLVLIWREGFFLVFLSFLAHLGFFLGRDLFPAFGAEIDIFVESRFTLKVNPAITTDTFPISRAVVTDFTQVMRTLPVRETVYYRVKPRKEESP
jgi:hypothetical protein